MEPLAVLLSLIVGVTQLPGFPRGLAWQAAECETPGRNWIWCDDFERDRLDAYFEYDSAGGAFRPMAGSGVGGSRGMRASYTVGQPSAGSLKLAFGRTPGPYFRSVDAGVTSYREIYWRFYLRREPGWRGGGGHKLSRALSIASADWSTAMIAHLWSGSPPNTSFLVIDPASGTDAAGRVRTTGYNDFRNLRWLGSARGVRAVFDDRSAGAWQCIEAHVRLNQSGRRDGVFEVWVDGRLDATRGGLDWVGRFTGYGINAVFLENYWNSGAPRAVERSLDDFVVSTARVGCH